MKSIHQEDIATFYVDSSGNRPSKYMEKYWELEGKTDKSTIKAEDANILLSIIDRIIRQKIIRI